MRPMSIYRYYYVEFKYILNQSIKEIAIHVLNVNIEQLE